MHVSAVQELCRQRSKFCELRLHPAGSYMPNAGGRSHRASRGAKHTHSRPPAPNSHMIRAPSWESAPRGEQRGRPPWRAPPTWGFRPAQGMRRSEGSAERHRSLVGMCRAHVHTCGRTRGAHLDVDPHALGRQRRDVGQIQNLLHFPCQVCIILPAPRRSGAVPVLLQRWRRAASAAASPVCCAMLPPGRRPLGRRRLHGLAALCRLPAWAARRRHWQWHCHLPASSLAAGNVPDLLRVPCGAAAAWWRCTATADPWLVTAPWQPAGFVLLALRCGRETMGPGPYPLWLLS